jgi:hypothetical protein
MKYSIYLSKYIRSVTHMHVCTKSILFWHMCVCYYNKYTHILVVITFYIVGQRDYLEMQKLNSAIRNKDQV